jgi:hypothetical protein
MSRKQQKLYAYQEEECEFAKKMMPCQGCASDVDGNSVEYSWGRCLLCSQRFAGHVAEDGPYPCCGGMNPLMCTKCSRVYYLEDDIPERNGGVCGWCLRDIEPEDGQSYRKRSVGPVIIHNNNNNMKI